MQHDAQTEPDRTAPDRSRQSRSGKSNDWIAERLRQAARLLAAQDANSFRVSAYRNAADAIEQSAPDIRSMMETDGHAALEGVGACVDGPLDAREK
jgi:DNA polymerase/3'-5' exonuclease PolX